MILGEILKFFTFYHFDSDPRFPPFLLYVRWKSGVSFVQRRCPDAPDILPSHPYHLDESILIFRDIRSKFSFSFNFSIKFMKANRIAQDGTPRFAASYLGLSCLPMSHKKDARLIWANIDCIGSC